MACPGADRTEAFLVPLPLVLEQKKGHCVASAAVLAASLIVRQKVGIERGFVPFGDRSCWVGARRYETVWIEDAEAVEPVEIGVVGAVVLAETTEIAGFGWRR
jgi:hypothetical protein